MGNIARESFINWSLSWANFSEADCAGMLFSDAEVWRRAAVAMLAEWSPRTGAPEAATRATKTAAARRRTKGVPAFVTGRLWRRLLFSVIYTTFYSAGVTIRRRHRRVPKERPAPSSGRDIQLQKHAPILGTRKGRCKRCLVWTFSRGREY